MVRCASFRSATPWMMVAGPAQDPRAGRIPTALVSSSAMPEEQVEHVRLHARQRSHPAHHEEVRIAAGTLPQARRVTIFQSTVPCLPWTAVPTVLVIEA